MNNKHSLDHSFDSMMVDQTLFLRIDIHVDNIIVYKNGFIKLRLSLYQQMILLK
jgi:hypothetical protein